MAEPNGLNPVFDRIGLPGDVWILYTTGTDDSTIAAEIGVPGTDMAAGSIAIASDGKVWVGVGTTWTQLNIN
jgi:hypothetical protein